MIGEGGMGMVYEATHERLAGRYAIKMLLQSLSHDPDALARFEREARVTSLLQHPNIVQVMDFNKTDDGTEYLVMEYLQGESLASRLAREGCLSVEAVVGIVEQLAAGLVAAHRLGIVHRDLKPDNVFLIPVEGRSAELVKILDFGISKARDIAHGPDGPVSALIGTPQYMSPEQCKGVLGDVDAATDQFALAAITFEMLTGTTPFGGESVGKILSRVLYEEPIGIAGNLEVDGVVRRGLSKSSGERFESVTAFADALRESAPESIVERSGASAQTGDISQYSEGQGARGGVLPWTGMQAAEAASAAIPRARRFGARPARVASVAALVGLVALLAPVGHPGSWTLRGAVTATPSPRLAAREPQPPAPLIPVAVEAAARPDPVEPAEPAEAIAPAQSEPIPLDRNVSTPLASDDHRLPARAHPPQARWPVPPTPTGSAGQSWQARVSPPPWQPPAPTKHRDLSIDQDATLPLDETVGDQP
jgi:serine/threonine-protein kinase